MEDNVIIVGEFEPPIEGGLWYPRGIINLNPWKTLYSIDAKTLYVKEIGRMKRAGVHKIDVKENVEDFKDVWRKSRSVTVDENVENPEYISPSCGGEVNSDFLFDRLV